MTDYVSEEAFARELPEIRDVAAFVPRETVHLHTEQVGAWPPRPATRTSFQAPTCGRDPLICVMKALAWSPAVAIATLDGALGRVREATNTSGLEHLIEAPLLAGDLRVEPAQDLEQGATDLERFEESRAVRRDTSLAWVSSLLWTRDPVRL